MMSKQDTILVVDDEPDTRNLVLAMLEPEGFKVLMADGAKQALEILETSGAESFRAIYLDILMPDTNGLDLLVRLKANSQTQNIPVVLLTAVDKNDDVLTGYKLGASCYVVKPFTREQLVYSLEVI